MCCKLASLLFELLPLTQEIDYRIAGYFRGVLIFVIFMVNPGVTKLQRGTGPIRPSALFTSLFTSSITTQGTALERGPYGSGALSTGHK